MSPAKASVSQREFGAKQNCLKLLNQEHHGKPSGTQFCQLVRPECGAQRECHHTDQRERRKQNGESLIIRKAARPPSPPKPSPRRPACPPRPAAAGSLQAAGPTSSPSCPSPLQGKGEKDQKPQTGSNTHSRKQLNTLKETTNTPFALHS